VNDGGCICIRGPAALFEDCRFVNNSGGHWGGSVALIYRYSYNFTRCIFINSKSMNSTDNSGVGGGVCIWDELVNVFPSFKFDHCFFEGNDAMKGKDIGLASHQTHFNEQDVISSYFNHSLSRTRSPGNTQGLIYKQNGDSNLDSLVSYSHGEYLYARNDKTTDKDIEYCGCSDYPCYTVEYTYGRYVIFYLFFFFFCFFIYLLFTYV
jgi:hypothetical protein